jgi:uncharacterized coiled-coil protein SlyX
MKDMNWPERVAYLENQLADSDRDNRRLREFIEGLPDGDEIVRLRGLLTRIHGIAAEPRPVNMEVRLENIACIAQEAEPMKINDEGRSNAAHWYERAMKAEARIKPLEETVAAQYAHNVQLEVRLQKIMARCADLLDEDQFNELDAMTRTTVTVKAAP